MTNKANAHDWVCLQVAAFVLAALSKYAADRVHGVHGFPDSILHDLYSLQKRSANLLREAEGAKPDALKGQPQTGLARVFFYDVDAQSPSATELSCEVSYLCRRLALLIERWQYERETDGEENADAGARD